MNQDTLSLTMFWVGAMFAFTPMLVVGVVIGTTWYLRRKRRTNGAPSQP